MLPYELCFTKKALDTATFMTFSGMISTRFLFFYQKFLKVSLKSNCLPLSQSKWTEELGCLTFRSFPAF